MTASKLEVNTGTLRSDTASVQREISALKQDAETLRQLAVRLNQMWQGEAKAEFLSNCERELNGLDAAISGLERFTRSTESAGLEYESCERSVASVVDALKV